jgi:hypothetical protein
MHMKILIYIGAPLLALGIAGVIWGLVSMYDDRDTIEIGDSQIVLDKGDFPPVGIAGAIVAGVGLVMVVAGGVASKKH